MLLNFVSCLAKIFSKNFQNFQGGAMLKQLSILIAISYLASCASKPKEIKDELNEFKVEEGSADYRNSNFQTVNSAAEAAELNKQAEIQEIEVQDRVLFGYDSSSLSDEAKKILDTQVAWLQNDSKIRVTVEGHCDERGTREYNIALGERRANSVKNYLVAKGVDSGRLDTVSYGKERPAFFGDNDKIMAKNRRAVTVVN